MLLQNDLTKAEMIVMKAIWNLEGTNPALHNITEEVNTYEDINWRFQTVSTFLAHLVQKGYLKMDRKGKMFYYSPLIKKEDYTKHLLLGIATWYDDSTEPLDLITEILADK